MAAIALEKLEDQLNCPICLDTFTNPKLLPCHHVYCQKCLVKLVDRDQQGQLILTCPNCRQVTPVPADGVAGLQSAFRVNQLLEIVEEQRKSGVPTIYGDMTTGSIACPDHEGRKMELYCDTCEKTICFKCVIKEEKHHDHNYIELSKALNMCQQEAPTLLVPLEKQLSTISKALDQLETQQDEVLEHQTVIESDIHSTIELLQHILEVRKTKLLSQLHEMTDGKVEGLAMQRTQLETTHAQLSYCLRTLKDSIESENQEGALLYTTVKQAKVLTATFPPEMLKPVTNADMVFLPSLGVDAECQSYGQISVLDPSKCYAFLKNVASLGDELSACLRTLSINSRPCKVSLDFITCELFSEVTETRLRCSVRSRGDSQYEISYQPLVRGKHQLYIQIQGQDIKGSPYPITVTTPVESISVPIMSICGVENPAGIAINHRGELVVAKEAKHNVIVISRSGKKLRSFGAYGSAPGEFHHPQGIAVDKEGNILVADYGNHRIQKFTAEGTLLGAVGTKGCGPLQFYFPRGIAVSASNGRVYVGNLRGHIQVLNSDLTYHDTFGKQSRHEIGFEYPERIACDSTGNVYVADSNSLIHVLTAEGEFLRQFGSCGDGRWYLNGPCGVAIDSNNTVFVSEYHNHCISVFTNEGQFLTSFGRKGGSLEEFLFPSGVAVDSAGVLYVCDTGNNCIKVF